MSHDSSLLQRLEMADRFSDLDAFVVAIENRDTGRTLDFVSKLVPRIEGDHDHFEQVLSRIDPSRFRPWSLLYVEEKDLIELRDNLEEYNSLLRHLAQSPSLTTLFESINNTITSTMVGELFTGFLDQNTNDNEGPVKFDFLISVLGQMKDRIEGSAGFTSPWHTFFIDKGWEDEAEAGYFWTEDKKYLLIFVTPVLKGGGFSRAQQALVALRQVVASTRNDFPDVNAGVTGQKALDEDQKTAALRDISIATVLSLVGLAVLLVLFWRGIERPLLLISTLVIALFLTFGFTTLLIGHLNILSVAFAPTVLGLGIDYGIHWFSRYREEQRKPGCPLEATMTKIGPVIILAGLCASLSFFPLALTGFKGLSELGIICAAGMVLATLVTLCPLPAFIVLLERRKRGKQVFHPPQAGEVKPLFNITSSSAFLILALTAATSGVSLWASGKIRFDLDLLRLQSKNAESVIWENKLIEGSKFPSIYGVIFAHSLEEVEKKTKALKGIPTVSEVQSIDTFLPPDQHQKIQLLEKMKSLLAGITSIPQPSGPVNIERIDEVFSRMRFKIHGTSSATQVEAQMEHARDLIDSIRNDFHSTDKRRLLKSLTTFQRELFSDLNDKLALLLETMNTGPMQISDLPEALRDRFAGPGNLYPLRVFPVQDIWEPQFLAPFVRDLRSVDPDAVGDPVMLYIATKAFRDASIKAAGFAIVFICISLTLTLRSALSTITALAPFLIGTVWTFGLMRLFGIDLNLANSIFLPLVVGAGVEYGIIIVGRWRQEEDSTPFNLPSTTGAGVVLAGLSTTVGFGSLTISTHRGIHSLGLLATIGSLSVLAAAVLFLPSLLRVVSEFQGKKKRAGDSARLSGPKKR